MTTIGIYRPGTPATLQATVDIDEKTRMIKKLMGDWHVTADFNVTSVLDIQIGDYITYDGENYYINRLPDITKQNNATFQYKIDFEHSLYNLKKKLFISYDGLADFSYNGTAEDFITNIVAAINEIDSGWTVGTVDATDPITLQFTNESCHAALVRVAEAFGLEWTIASKAISLEASVGTIRELTFEYGRGSGLYKLTRQQVHDQNITTKVYGFGGDKNISEDYRNRAKRLVFAATGQQPCSASSYPYLTNNIDLYGTIEGQFTDDNIYPQRTSTLTGASISFAAAAPYAFSERSSYVEDSEMDFDINDYLIDGKVATIVFKTGDLAGIECEIWKYDHNNKRFYIRSYADVDGYVMPNYNSGSPIQPEIGDSYTLVNIAMPQTYIDTAEAALQAATQTYINENSVPLVVYDCLFDWKYAKTQELELDAGDKVTVTDSDLGVDAQVRIAAIEYPLVNIYKIKATIADFVPYTLQERIIKTTISTKKETVFVERRNTELARRNTMRQNQMQGMLFDSDGYFDPENIKPLSIETTYLSVGTKSRDFWLSNVTIKANYEGDANALYVTAGSLIHLQLEITGLGYEWVISTPLDQDSLTPATAYYLYAKCSTSALTGEWILSASQITTEEVSGYYHFLIGMLFAVSDDRRDFDFTNGMTYIDGGTITTGKIQSIGGNSYFDLTQNKFMVGDSNSSLDWNDTAASTLTIKGALVQSGAGTTSVLPCFRGAYASGYTYYKGDEVTYEGSTFRWINDTPASGQTPAEGGYWTTIAAAGSGSIPGKQGDPGNYIEYQYAKNGSTTTPPSIVNTDLNPSGWSTTPPSTGNLEYLWMTKATKTYDGSVLVSNWTTPVRIKGEAGATGDTGPTGATGASPAGVYRGEYDSGSTYYGTEHRVDIVYYSGLYYVARVDAGDGFSDKVPTNTDYWNSFGANFESIATGLLFAEFAYIENLGVRHFAGEPVGAGNLDGTVANTTANLPDIYRVYLSGDSGTANIECNGTTRLATFNSSLSQTCADFVAAYVSSYPGLTLGHTPGNDYFTFTGLITSFSFTPVSGNLYVNGHNYRPAVARKDTITLTGDSGQAEITCNKIKTMIYYNDTLPLTASGFAIANASRWAASGVLLSASAQYVIVEAATAGLDFSGSTTIENVENVYSGAVRIEGNDIWENDYENVYDMYNPKIGTININRRGYQGGFTHIRNVVIWDGTGNQIMTINGFRHTVKVEVPGFYLPDIPSSNPGLELGQIYYDPSTKNLKIDL